MKVCLVRHVESWEIVGIFCVNSIADDLPVLVDECTDPGICVWREMPVGGLMWHQHKAPSVPFVPPDAPIDPEAPEAEPDAELQGPSEILLHDNPPVFSERWYDVFHDRSAHWLPMPPMRLLRIKRQATTPAK